MNLPDHYLLTVALHAAVLSVAVFLAVLCVRKPQRVALLALSGLLAIAVLPWFSALRPERRAAIVPSSSSSVPRVAALPEWTVVRLPAKVERRAAPPVLAPRSSFAMPEGRTLLAAAWALGAALVLGRLLIAAGGVFRWQRKLAVLDEVAWQAILDAAPDAPGQKHFRISPGTGSPCVAGFFKPVIVVPSFLLDPAKKRELQWALRHELRHWHGADSRWTVVLELVRAIQWWNPLVHPLISRWKIAREFICDLSAADEDRETYGEFLISMASRQASWNPLAVTMVRRQRLKALRLRIVSMLNAAPGTVVAFEKRVFFSACLALLVAGLMTSGVKVASEPSRAPEEAREANREEAVRAGAKVVDPPGPKMTKPERTFHVEAQVTMVFSDVPIAGDEKVLSKAATEEMMEELSRDKTSRVMNDPAAATHIVGEGLSCEMIHEHPENTFTENEILTGRPDRFAGWILQLDSGFNGEKLELSADLDYRFVPGAQYAEESLSVMLGEDQPAKLAESKRNAAIAWDKLRKMRGASLQTLDPGETLVLRIGQVKPGRHLTLLVTANPIDQTGRPVPDFKSAMFEPPHPIQGKLRLRATLARELGGVDRQFRGMVGEGLPDIAFDLGKKEWEELKGDLTGAKQLPAAEISAHKFQEPWAELKGISFSAELYREADKSVLGVSFPDDQIPATGIRNLGLPLDPGVVHAIILPKDGTGDLRVLYLEIEDVE